MFGDMVQSMQESATPCFETFHTNANYKEVLLEMRFGNNGTVGGGGKMGKIENNRKGIM